MWTPIIPQTPVAVRILEYDVLLSTFVVIISVWMATVIFWRSYQTSLWKIPGPLLCSFTNLPLEYHMAIGNYHQFTRNLHLQYGPVVRIGYNKVSVSDPLELKHILSTHEFRKGSFYKAMEKVFPSTFTTTNPGFNKTRRRQLGNSYSLPSVRLYESKIFEHGVLSLISLWDSQISLSPGRDRAIVNFHYGFHGLAFDIIGVLGFGKSFNILSTGDTKIINNVGKFVKLGAITSGMPLGKYLEWFLGDWVDAGKYVLTVIDDTIRSRKQENAESAASDHVDILQRLVSARDPLTGESIDDVSLRSEILIMLLAGTDTSSNTLDWIVLRLLQHPCVYERLKNEIRTVFPDKYTLISFDDARNKLPYLTAVIYEVMRLHPAVSGYMPRSVPEKGAHIMGGRYYLPQGTELCVSLFACHRNQDVWPSPDEFDPERFMGPDAERRIKDVLAFGSGVRICIGRYLGLVELYTTLANLVRRYDFKLPDAEERRYDFSAGEIPGKSFFIYTPTNADKNCQMVVSPAK